MRYVVLGAGAVGGTVGVRLHRAGRDVVLVARGGHGDAIRAGGLTLREPEGSDTQRIPCVWHPRELALGASDVVILGVKTQDAAAALADLDQRVTVVCTQNGVATEPMAAERGGRVVGMMTWIPAVHLEPGVVEVYAVPPAGVFRVGNYASGRIDAPPPADQHGIAAAIAADLSAAGFDAAAVPDVMRWKHSKLLNNLGNVLDAFCVRDETLVPWLNRAAVEGEACLRAAGIDFIPRHELFEDMRARVDHRATIGGERRGGGSTWQSVSRGMSTEVQHLNGWICELGHRVGVPTPVNKAFLRLPAEATGPRSVPLSRLDELVAQETPAQQGVES